MPIARVAGGNINPCRFVNPNASNPFTVDEADAGEIVTGISQEGAKAAPIPGASTLAAAAGDPIKVYTEGEECLLEIGSGGCTAGDKLKSDADGKGITTTTANDLYGAIALETAAAGEKARVQVSTQRKV